jgi:glycosyltransferase involved in cell wall biosynthesis
LTSALNELGVGTTSVVIMTKYLETSNWETRGYGGSRGIPLSPRFLWDLVTCGAQFFVCREYGLETLLTTLIARIRRRKSIVFQEHVGRAGMPLSRLDRTYRRLIGRLAHGFIANTPAAADEIVGTLRVASSRVASIMMLIPPNREQLLRGSFEPPTARERPVFLFVGQLALRKNVEALLMAASILRREGLTFEIWIAGEGDDEARLRALAEELELDVVVRFLGPVAHQSVGHLHEASDVFVMPSYADLLSVAVLEAVRFGKPVICSRSVGALGVVAHEDVNALAFHAHAPADLAEKMRWLISRPERIVEMGARSASLMDAHTPEIAARALVGALRALP